MVSVPFLGRPFWFPDQPELISEKKRVFLFKHASFSSVGLPYDREHHEKTFIAKFPSHSYDLVIKPFWPAVIW